MAHSYEPILVPGPLQTPGYAHAVIRRVVNVPPDEVDGIVVPAA
ncbi:MAG: Scr1 family TA system antitoxin-like transcriptional regulator [Pseudonocardiaceae bacterium]